MVKTGRIKVMARHNVSVTSITNSATLLSLEWSLKSMTTWLQIFGIQPPLISSINHYSRCNRFVVLIPIAIVLYLLNVGCHAFALGQLNWNATKKNYNSSTRNWNLIIDETNFSFLTMATHSTLLLVSYFLSWRGLTEVLHRLEKCHQFDSTHYKKFRSVSTVGSCFIIIEIVIEFIETLSHNLLFQSNTTSTLHVILSGLRMVSLIFPYLGSIMFCGLGWMAAIMLRIIAEEIKWSTIHRPDNTLRLNNWVGMSFEGWRRRYFLIVEFVHQINHHFGFILLVVTAWDLSTILITFDFIKETACFFVLLYVPTRIHREASDLVKHLRMMDLDDYGLRNKMKFLVEEMTHSLPSVAPMGLFQANIQLIPTLIGTTLTYLIILCQFHSSETVK